jgi:hypothetical protein
MRSAASVTESRRWLARRRRLMRYVGRMVFDDAGVCDARDGTADVRTLKSIDRLESGANRQSAIGNRQFESCNSPPSAFRPPISDL